MSFEARSINLTNVDDAIWVINESSRGTPVEYQLNSFEFLSLAAYWNYSYPHSFVAYVDNKPAAIVVNCVEPEAHEAFTAFWGCMPEYRDQRLGMRIFEHACQKLRNDGYLRMYGDAAPQRKVRRYRFIDGRPRHNVLQMEAERSHITTIDGPFEIRPIEVADLAQLSLPPNEPLHWCQRPDFLRRSAATLTFLGAFSANTLHAYAVYVPRTQLLFQDLRLSDLVAGRALLSWLKHNTNSSSFGANFVFENTLTHQLFDEAGLQVKSSFSTLSRDLQKLPAGDPR